MSKMVQEGSRRDKGVPREHKGTNGQPCGFKWVQEESKDAQGGVRGLTEKKWAKGCQGWTQESKFDPKGSKEAQGGFEV